MCVPVVLWLLLVQPISLRTMHDEDEQEAHTGTPVPCCSRTLLFTAASDSNSTSVCYSLYISTFDHGIPDFIQVSIPEMVMFNSADLR